MIVTGIHAVTKQKFKVELDGQLAFILYKSELARYHIRNEEELSEEVYHEIVQEMLIKRAKKYVMHLLVKMDRTTYELEEKLRRGGYPQVAVEAAITYVESYGYLDDRRYAETYLQTAGERMSKKQLTWKLTAKGIKKDMIDSIYESWEGANESALIQAHIRKKVKDKSNLTDKELKRLADYLYRKGFEGSIIWDALKKLKSGNDDEMF